MRRRFTIAIVGVVAGSLLVAGLGTLILLTIQARRDARHEVTDLAVRIATEVSQGATVGSGLPAAGRLQNFLKRTQQATLISLNRGSVQGPLPAGVRAGDLDASGLLAGRTVSGFRGRTAYAAAPFTLRNRRLAAVVAQHSATPSGAGLYFLLAAALALLVAFVVAETLARRITHPLVSVQEAAGRIARGDLTARAPAVAGSYPELASLTTSLNAMADNLERLRGQERQFLLSVSHDLRTPLTSIRGFAEALADGTTTETEKSASIIAAEARRLERLVRDLLDLAKLDARQFAMGIRPVDLFEVVSDTAHGFEPTAERLGLRVVVHEPVDETGAGRQLVSADPDRLAQVVANLVENACKYAASVVEVGTWYRRTPSGPAAFVTVDDDGPGIPGADLPHVFERLWTASRGQARQLGSGLGLAIVSELVTAMGGAVWAESPVPGRTSPPGARLVVRLDPVVPAAGATALSSSL